MSNQNKSPFASTHVIFDLDGVLLDTEPKYSKASSMILAQYGKTFDMKIKAKMMGRVSSESSEIFINHYQIPLTPQEYLTQRETLLDQLLADVSPIRGAYELTQKLKSMGIPMAIATSSDTKALNLKLQNHLKWFKDFEHIVTGDNPHVEKGKPSPDIYLYAAKLLGASPSQCLVFEDAPNGIEAAKAAKMRVVGLRNPLLDANLYANCDKLIEDNFVNFDIESVLFKD